MEGNRFQGIVLSKVPQQERNVICSLLLRNGKRQSVMFYGGLGGGRKLKVSGIEVGNCVELTPPSNNRPTEVIGCREWSLLWQHEKIRHDDRGFSLMCFYLELMKLLAPESELNSAERGWDQTAEGLFRVLSNAVVRLEKNIEQKSFDMTTELIYFLAKLLVEQGVFPERNTCVLSGEPLDGKSGLALLSSAGGFAKIDHLKSSEDRRRSGTSGTQLWAIMREISITKYDALSSQAGGGKNEAQLLANYLFYQLQIEPLKIKSWSLLNL
jgi:recombinational DNA repair protein (RecF pathway)